MHCTSVIEHGIPCLRLEHADTHALVALHGAQVLSWRPADGRERLFLSRRSQFGGAAAIRGGIPVIFPQFSERGPLQRHGFARNRAWQFSGIEATTAVFSLDCSGLDPDWPHACLLQLHIALAAEQLELTLAVTNTGDAPFAFNAALHTYLRVDAVADCELEGLQGCDYEDNTGGGTLHRQSDYLVAFDGEVDRIYNDVVAPLQLSDGQHRLGIEQTGFADTVAWNPGAALAAGITDLADGDWRNFVCVEAAQVLQPVLLSPGERWQGSQRLR